MTDDQIRHQAIKARLVTLHQRVDKLQDELEAIIREI